MQRRIQQIELLTGNGRILNLQYRMPPGLAERAETLLRGKYVTRRSPDAANYVRHHLSELVRVERKVAFCHSRWKK